MYEACSAELEMKRSFLQDGPYNDNIYKCEVLTYKPEEEHIYFIVDEELSAFSLDCIYECAIISENQEVRCSGVLRERYSSKLGKVVIFQIQNGFYKNPLN